MPSVDDFIRQSMAEHFRGMQLPEDLPGFLSAGTNFWSRETFPYHVTASVFVVSPDRTSTLLMRPRALNGWLQPGGHLEQDEFPVNAAERELQEELGTRAPSGLVAHADDLPISIDIHAIPENVRKQEPAHYHIDFRYILFHAGDALETNVDEATDASWCDIDILRTMDGTIFEYLGR